MVFKFKPQQEINCLVLYLSGRGLIDKFVVLSIFFFADGNPQAFAIEGP